MCNLRERNCSFLLLSLRTIILLQIQDSFEGLIREVIIQFHMQWCVDQVLWRYYEVTRHIIYPLCLDHRAIHLFEVAARSERAMEVAMAIPVGDLIDLLEELALILGVVRDIIASNSELVSRTTQIEVRIIDTSDVTRYLLKCQVNLLLVANEIFTQVIDL